MSFINSKIDPLSLPDCGIRAQFLPHNIAETAQARIKLFMTTGYERDSTNVLTMIGPSGSGKSQIVRDMIRQIEFRPHWRLGDLIVYMDNAGGEATSAVPIVGRWDEGKSKILEGQASLEEIEVCRNTGDAIRPIVYAEVPSDISRKGILKKILIALGLDVKTTSVSVSDLMAQAHKQLKGQKCRLLILDEAQQMAKPALLYEYADFIRQFVNGGTIPLMLIGLPDTVKLTQNNEQMGRRAKSCIIYEALHWKEPRDKEAIDAILDNYQATLALANRPYPVTHDDIAKAIYRLSGGLVGRMSQFLGLALDLAYLTPSKLLTLDILKQAYREYRFLYASMHGAACPFTNGVKEEDLLPADFETGANPEVKKRKRKAEA